MAKDYNNLAEQIIAALGGKREYKELFSLCNKDCAFSWKTEEK